MLRVAPLRRRRSSRRAARRDRLAYEDLLAGLSPRGPSAGPGETPAEVRAEVLADASLGGEAAGHATLVLDTLERARFARPSDRPGRCGRDARARRRDPCAGADAPPIARPRGSLRACVEASSAPRGRRRRPRSRDPRGRIAIRAQGERLPPALGASIARRSIARSRRSRPRPRSCSTPSRGSWRERGAAPAIGGFPFDPAPGDMRAMADAVADALVGMDRRSRGRAGRRDRGSARARPATRGGAAGGGTRRLRAVLDDALTRRAARSSTPARVPRLHPRRRSLHGRARGVPRARAEPLRRAVAAEPRHRAARGERDAVALRTVRVPRSDGAGRADDRRVDGEPLRGRDGATHAAG